MISKILEPILNLFRFHKKKILMFPVFFLVFFYLLFPFNDLGDLVASKVSELTGNQVFVNFDSLGLGLVPQPHVNMENVVVESPYFPKLTVGELSLAPNLAGLLSFKPGVNVSASGLFGGEVDLYTRGGDKVANDKDGHYKQKIGLDLSNINLGDVSKSMAWPVTLQGKISGEVSSQVDPMFTEQPSGTVDMKIEKANLQPGNVPTPFGPLALPGIELGTVVLQAKKDLKSERPDSLEVSQLTVGKQGAEFYANLTGKMDIKFQKMGTSVMPQFGLYDFSVRLQLGETIRSKLGLFLNFISAHQKSPGVYAFRLSGSNFYAPPQISALQ